MSLLRALILSSTLDSRTNPQREGAIVRNGALAPKRGAATGPC